MIGAPHYPLGACVFRHYPESATIGTSKIHIIFEVLQAAKPRGGLPVLVSRPPRFPDSFAQLASPRMEDGPDDRETEAALATAIGGIQSEDGAGGAGLCVLGQGGPFPLDDRCLDDGLRSNQLTDSVLFTLGVLDSFNRARKTNILWPFSAAEA